jgi:hypothetical protein
MHSMYVYILAMAKTKRVQVLMEPEEFAALEQIAEVRGTSVAELMRDAARAEYLLPAEGQRRAEAARRFLALPAVLVPAWADLKREIEERRDEPSS